MKFTVYGTGENPEDVTAPFSYRIEGYSWDGVVATRLFDFTLTATLRLSKTAPVVH